MQDEPADDGGFLSSLDDLRLELDRQAPDIDPGLAPIFFPDEPDRRAMSHSLPLTSIGTEPLTYEPFFGLEEAPFSANPAQRFLFRSRSYNHAERQVVAALARRDRLVVVTGEPGTGKTMLCHSIVPQLDRRTVASFVADPVVSIEELYETLLIDFGVISKGSPHRGDRASLEDALRDFLATLARIHSSAVVVVDDAQNLSTDILRGLRTLVETTASDEAIGSLPLLQLLLVGGPDLVALLRKSELRKHVPDITQVALLGPLEPDEVESYIRQRLSVAGNDQIKFEPDAVQRIANWSFGVPRVVNQLCNRALADAHQRSIQAIDVSSVAAAAEGLDLAPPPAPARSLWSGVLTGLVFGFLLLLGAALAAAVFRDQVAALLGSR